MRITHILTLGGIALLVAGCEDTGRQARYATGSSYGGQVISSSPSSGTTSYPSGGTTSYPSAAYPAPAPATPSYSPPGMTEADLSLANAVRQQLNRYGDLITAMSTLQISARNGTVTLAGAVQSQRERDMIDALTKNTPGVLGVNDQMQVSAAPSAAYSQSDQALANQLEQALYNTPTVASFAPNIRINVQNGKVILTGNVPSEQDRQSVDNVVRNTPGVVSVVDQLGISTVPTGRVAETSRVYRPDPGQMFNLHVQGLTETDRALAQRILDGLRTETTLLAGPQTVDITVANGKITLQGMVQGQQQKRDIIAAVRRAAGVSTVYDELQVTSQP